MPRKMRPQSRPKPSGFAKALADTSKVETLLLGDMQKYVLKRADEERRDDIIHPSEMAKPDWCPRATAFRLAGVEPTNEDPRNGSVRLLTIFQEGHDIHNKYQTYLYEMGRLYGLWRCIACRKETWGVSITECPHCGVKGALQYREIPLTDEPHLPMAGQADGGVNDLNALLEMKSIGTGTLRIEDPALLRKHTHKAADTGKTLVDLEGLWRGIKRPLRAHRIQGTIYLYMARRSGMNYDKMIFIYENKANQGTKEFHIPYNEDLIADVLDMAKDVDWAVKTNRTLPRPQGFTRDKRPCKDCVFQRRCWEGEEGEQDSPPQPETGDGRVVVRRSRPSRAAEDPAAEPARVRVSRTPRRSDQPGRRRPDGAVQPDPEVGGVPGRPTGNGRGRRTVRRRRTGAHPGGQEPNA